MQSPYHADNNIGPNMAIQKCKRSEQINRNTGVQSVCLHSIQNCVRRLLKLTGTAIMHSIYSNTASACELDPCFAGRMLLVMRRCLHWLCLQLMPAHALATELAKLLPAAALLRGSSSLNVSPTVYSDLKPTLTA